MRRRKLVLVNPARGNPFPGFPPLALGYVAALTPDHWDVEILDEHFEPATFRECDLVGITAFTAMANRAYQVAQIFRRQGVPVVMGGIHASMMPDEALRFVDSVVVGEAESVWGAVVADVEAGRLKQRYEGAPTNLSGLVIPRRDLFHDGYFCDSIQTARGCPNDCDFCSVSQFNGFSYRERPVEEVLDELETLRHKYVFFVDDNIVGSGAARRASAIALAHGIVERGLDLAWYSQAALNVADDDDVLAAFSQSGCRMLFLGFEAESRDVLESMKKRVNLRRDYDRVIRKIHDHGIGIHGSFILGTDDDTMETLRARFRFLVSTPIDVVQFCAFTPYPGTRLFDRMLEEGRLLHTDFPADWDRYDLTEALVVPRHLELDEYRKLMSELGRALYNPEAVAKRFLRSLRETRSLDTAFWCLFTNALYRGPSDASGRPGQKFWRLSRTAWPAIHLYEQLERRARELAPWRPMARLARGARRTAAPPSGP